MSHPSLIKNIDRLLLAYAAVFVATVVVVALSNAGLALGERGVVGGDFLAFYNAGEMALQGHALDAYNAELFDAQLKSKVQLNNLGMSWQYPPIMFLPTALFALLPYKLSFILWIAAGWAFLGWSLWSLDIRGSGWRIMMASPFCVAIIHHGQISHLTAGLLFLAAYDPKKRWLIAGIAAGILTIKPQLGLLLPFAFLAVGAWRTIGVAVATALALHATSLLVFGIDGVNAFMHAAGYFNAEITGQAVNTPPRGMTTIFGQLKLMGVPGRDALYIQAIALAGLAALTVMIWRRQIDPLAKAAFLSAATILATPYAYGYEMTVLLLAGVWLARHQTRAITPIGIYLIAISVVVMARPFLPELRLVNTAFLITASAFLVLTGTLFTRQAVAPVALRA